MLLTTVLVCIYFLIYGTVYLIIWFLLILYLKANLLAL
jgi:hypothetical protein